MNKDSKNVVIVNLLYWAIAALLHPLSQLLPTESGEPPKFFSFLIPLIFLMLASFSTAMISQAIRNRNAQ